MGLVLALPLWRLYADLMGISGHGIIGIGPADADLAMGIALDGTNNLYVTGYTYSADYPVVTPIAGHISGATDVFVEKIGTATPAGPDLIVASVSPPAYGVLDQKVSISTKVVNQGVVASKPCTISLYLSTALTLMPTPGDRAIFLGSGAVPRLKPDAGSTISISLPLPPDVPPGSYYVVGLVDRGKTVDESDETNNSQASTKLMTVYRPRADLIGVSVSGPSKARLGRAITITSKIKNQGYGNAKNYSVGICLSADTTVDTSDTLFGKRPVSLLIPGGNNSASISVQITMGLTPGTYYIGLIADPDNDVVELDKANNSKAGNKIVIAP
ncbi:MAG: CARDB domain-containing protein [Syntrophobacter sp.]